MTDRELAVVTGSTRGIGKAIALKLAKDNYDIIIFGRDKKAAQSVVDEILETGVEADYYLGDVADEEFVKNSVKDILKNHSKIDHLINNAGFGIFKKLIDSDLAELKGQFETNVYGVYNFCRAVLPQMIERRSGSIVNIASLAGKNAFIGGTMYSASKHALLGLTRSLMLEVREYNIRVAAICPGSVATEFFPEIHKEQKNADRILHASNIADVVSLIIRMPLNALVSEVDIRPTNPK